MADERFDALGNPMPPRLDSNGLEIGSLSQAAHARHDKLASFKDQDESPARRFLNRTLGVPLPSQEQQFLQQQRDQYIPNGRPISFMQGIDQQVKHAPSGVANLATMPYHIVSNGMEDIGSGNWAGLAGDITAGAGLYQGVKGVTRGAAPQTEAAAPPIEHTIPIHVGDAEGGLHPGRALWELLPIPKPLKAINALIGRTSPEGRTVQTPITTNPDPIGPPKPAYTGTDFPLQPTNAPVVGGPPSSGSPALHNPEDAIAQANAQRYNVQPTLSRSGEPMTFQPTNQPVSAGPPSSGSMPLNPADAVGLADAWAQLQNNSTFPGRGVPQPEALFGDALRQRPAGQPFLNPRRGAAMPTAAPPPADAIPVAKARPGLLESRFEPGNQGSMLTQGLETSFSPDAMSYMQNLFQQIQMEAKIRELAKGPPTK